MTSSLRILAIVLPLFLTASLSAQRQTFTVNPDASDVAFTLGANDHATRGNFHVSSGTIIFDRATPKMSGNVVVSSGSGKTGNDSRDKKMWNEVLDSPHFADITFAPESYTGTVAATGDSTIQVTGIFTLHGTPHEMTVPMAIHVEGTNLTAKTHFIVPYVKWGLKDPSIFILKVAKEVNIDLNLAGRVS